MKTLIAAAVVAALAFADIAHAGPLPEARPDEVGFSQAGLARMDDFFAREISAKRVPGAVVAIARDGKLVHYKAYGQLDASRGTPMPVDAVFALASMTKPMAAVAGLTLMEQGRLPLQARLTEYYPAFANMMVGSTQSDGSLKTDPQASPIYIHDLYRHTSGLMYGGRPDSSRAVAGGQHASLHRSHHEVAAGASAVDGIRIWFFDRRARRGGRKGQRAAARRIPGRQCMAAARHDRRHVPSVGSAAHPSRPSVPERSADRQATKHKIARHADQIRLRRGLRVRHRRRLHPLRADAAQRR